MGLWDTYRTIREARRQHLPESAEVAGDEGERLVLETTEQLIHRRAAKLGCRCYPALRVPRPGDKGKYEIDLLVASPFGLASLEVKNWGGEVEAVRPDTWLQINSQGASREYDDPLALVQEKTRAVESFLAKQGVAVPANSATAAVVLTNMRLTLGPRVSQMPGVLRLVQLEEMLTPWINPNAVGFWSGLARMFGLARTASPIFSDFAAVTRALDRLPTWDLIELHGGRVLKGDIVGSGIALKSGNHLTRRDARLIQVHIPRSWLFGWFATPCVTWTDAGSAQRSEPVRLGSTIAMRRAGQRQDEPVPIEHIRAVSFGCSDHGYYDAPRPSLVQ